MQKASKTQFTESLQNDLIIAAKGFVMGCADVVPGVSGGTMALILGVYERLITSLSNISEPEFLSTLFKRDFGEAFSLINLRFLFFLALGIGVAILSLAQVLEHLLLTQPVLVYSFFFGLIAASVWVVAKMVSAWNLRTLSAFVVGALIALVIVGLTPAATPEAGWFIVLSGAIAICALILPGISGSFILLLMGKYAFILNAVNERRLGIILLFAVGAGIGLLAFSKVLKWLLKHYHDTTIALLGGFMLGSLRRIWPWKANPTLELSPNVLPALGPGLLYALLLALLGCALVLLLARQGEKTASR